MAKVCEDWYPMGTFKNQKSPGFYMDKTLKSNIDALINNVTDDWDFVIIITGSGAVRVGKSVLANQIGIYWSYEIWKRYGIKVPFNTDQNIVYKGDELIKKGNFLGRNHKYSVLNFDEAGADLEGAKAMRKTTQNVKDYLRECGQYNMLTILVLPEFFDLPKGIAMNRADILIDCKVHSVTNKEGIDKFDRGYFNFYSRPTKKKLYMFGKKELNYDAVKEDFYGHFDAVYPREVYNNSKGYYLGGSCEDFENNYRELKKIALKNREQASAKDMRRDEWMRGALKYVYDAVGNYRDAAVEVSKRSKIPITFTTLGKILTGTHGYTDLKDEENDDF